MFRNRQLPLQSKRSQRRESPFKTTYNFVSEIIANSSKAINQEQQVNESLDD